MKYPKVHTIKPFLLLLIIGLSLFFGFFLFKSEIDYNLEDFFPEKDSSAHFFEEYRQSFSSDNDFLLIGIENNPSIFDSLFLRKVQLFSAQLEKLPYVESSIDITQLDELLIYDFGITGKRAYIQFNNNDFKEDSIRIFQSPDLLNKLVNKEGNALLVLLKHTDYLSKKKSDQLVDNVQKLLDTFDFEKAYLSGRTVGQKYFLSSLLRDLKLFIALGFLLILIVLWLISPSLGKLFIASLILILSLIWTFGLLAFSGKSINLLLVTLPPILLVVAMSDIIHLLSQLQDLEKKELSPKEKIKVTIKEIGLATFLTSLTTAIGFWSLIFVGVKPIQDYGLYSGIGVITTFIITYSLLPFLVRNNSKKRKLSFQHINWKEKMQHIFLFTFRYQRILLIFLISVLITAGIGISKLEVNSYLADNVNQKSQMIEDFQYFDQHFGGIRPFELAIQLKDKRSSFWEIEKLEQLAQLEDYLKESYGVVINTSIVQQLSIINRSSHLGNPNYFKLSSQQKEINQWKRMLRINQKGETLSIILNESEDLTRISGRIPDWGSQKIRLKNKELITYIQENGLEENFKFNITGSAELLDTSISFMSKNLIYSLLFAIGIVSLFMGILYRSVKMLFISLLPNLLPLFITAGIMGLIGIPLNITTALVFTISFGIAVDDTIHFLNRYKIERKKGIPPIYAIRNSYLKTGKAIILTSTVLLLGFSALLFSNFLAIFYLGLLASITIISTLLCDLFLLPHLLIKIKQ